MNTKAILKDRQAQHGDYKDRADLTIDLQNTIDYYRYDLNDNLPNYQLDALRMICVKIARIVNGDNNYADHWLDISGYATLVCEELTKDHPAPNSPKGKQ
ncbi:hypothetical protein EB001_14725 [bacterium]|nr:hypothetical protein [bacterium]